MNNKEFQFKDAPHPYWLASTPETNYPSLNEDVKVDVAIVGGGMVGITSAYLLKKKGLKVAVIEADRILQGTTGHTTAKITSQHSLVYDKMKKQLGESLARQYAEANETAIHTIADIVKEKNIDCDFEWESAYIYTEQDNYIKKIEDEAKAAASLGIKAYYLDETPLPFSVKAAVRFDHQAKFHPRKYLLTLAKEIPGDGSHIFEETKAVDIKEGDNPEVLTEKGKKVTAANVIIASHYPFYDGGGLFVARMYAEKSYVLGILIKENYPGGMYITAEDPGRSLRSQKYGDRELILVSGEHHKTGHGENTNAHYLNLMEFANNTFTVEDIPYRWSTQDCHTVDDVPYVGRLTSKTRNIFVATGFKKWGMTNSTASAMILTDLITKGESPWQEVYSPSRFGSAASIVNAIAHNADVAANYISGKLEIAPTDINIKEGEAKIITVDGQKVGAYRDEKGVLHIVDTTCTHVGCELKWNDAEKTWDCPCHGSRFTYDGDIVEGPAHYPLKHLDEGRNNVEPNLFK